MRAICPAHFILSYLTIRTIFFFFLRSTNHEVFYYAVFTSLLLFLPSQAQIFSSVAYQSDSDGDAPVWPTRPEKTCSGIDYGLTIQAEHYERHAAPCITTVDQHCKAF